MPKPQRQPSAVLDLLAVIWTWTVVAFVLLIALIGMILLPRLVWRRALTARLTRLMLMLTGVRVRVSGAEHIPAGTAVVVANHASVLDGPLLHMLLPARFGFVIKREITQVPGIHFLLRRLGSVFADRVSATRAGRDGQFIIRSVRDGRCLAIFPEGSVAATPGLRNFRMGAFLAATRGNAPILPVTIKGSRSVFPDDGRRLYPGTIEVQIHAPIAAGGSDRTAATALRDAARSKIAEDCNEPDQLIAQLPL